MTGEKKKMTAHGSSVGADDRQSISTNSKFIIPDPEEKSNSPERDLQFVEYCQKRKNPPFMTSFCTIFQFYCSLFSVPAIGGVETFNLSFSVISHLLSYIISIQISTCANQYNGP